MHPPSPYRVNLGVEGRDGNARGPSLDWNGPARRKAPTIDDFVDDFSKIGSAPCAHPASRRPGHGGVGDADACEKSGWNDADKIDAGGGVCRVGDLDTAAKWREMASAIRICELSAWKDPEMLDAVLAAACAEAGRLRRRRQVADPGQSRCVPPSEENGRGRGAAEALSGRKTLSCGESLIV